MLASPCLLPFALPLLLLLSLTSFLMSSLLTLDPQAVLPLLMLPLPPHLLSPPRLASFLPLNQARPRRGLRWVVFPNNMSEWSSLHPSPKCAAWTTTHQAVLQRCYQLKGNHHAFRHGQRHLILLEVQHHPRLTANEAVVNPCVCGAVHTAHGIFPSPHAVPRSPPAIGAPSVGRPRRGSSYISTGVLRVPSVASPFTAHTAECKGSQRPALRSCCPHRRRSRPLCRPLSGPGSTRSSHRPTYLERGLQGSHCNAMHHLEQVEYSLTATATTATKATGGCYCAFRPATYSITATTLLLKGVAAPFVRW